MTATNDLRASIAGLLLWAAAEEEMLLTRSAGGDDAREGPHIWAAAPTIAHNTEFKRQQVQRLEAVLRHEVPPAFAEVDHGSKATYRGYADQGSGAIAVSSRRTTTDLIGALAAVPDDDLLDPLRNPWLDGRQLWLQVVVRGFWHPVGHVGDFYTAHAMPGRALALRVQAVETAVYLGAPDPALGMAYYSLACIQAQHGHSGEARESLERAVDLNSDLLARAATEADLAPLRAEGPLLLRRA